MMRISYCYSFLPSKDRLAQRMLLRRGQTSTDSQLASEQRRLFSRWQSPGTSNRNTWTEKVGGDWLTEDVTGYTSTKLSGTIPWSHCQTHTKPGTTFDWCQKLVGYPDAKISYFSRDCENLVKAILNVAQRPVFLLGGSIAALFKIIECAKFRILPK